MNNKVKNILIVTHQFVPHQSPRTTRWKLIYDELVKKGFNIRVITGTKQDGSDSNIQYIGNKTASGVVSSLRKQSNTDQGSFYKNLALKFLKKIYRFFYKFFAWPDYTMFWVFSIWKNRKKIDFNYDVIISVSLPFSSHVAAYIINKEKRKKWIMDIGDPFSLKSNAFENNKYFYKSLNYYFENKFFNMADQIVFTHKDASLEHKEFFNINNEKIEIGNPISAFSKNVYQSSKTYNYNIEPIKIGYFGILTKGVRSPNEVLKYFQNLDYVFHWYTNPDSKNMILQNNIDNNKHLFFDMVPRNEALEIMVTSFHCLLSIGNLNASQLPSKVIEYISTGKPVIHFAEIANDPVIKISEKFKNLIVVTKKSDPLILNEQLTNVFQNIDKFDIEQFNNIYSAEAVTKKLNIF
jgi:hypothetical protein